MNSNGIKQKKKVRPSVPVTGLLWHLRTITSSLPFYSYRTKFTKSFIHLFGFLFFCLFCFIFYWLWKLGIFKIHFYPTSFFHYLQVYTNVRVCFVVVCVFVCFFFVSFKFCIKKLCWSFYCLFLSYGCSMRGLHCFWNDSPRHRLKWHWDRGFHGTLTK